MIELIKDSRYSLMLRIPMNDVSSLYNYLENLNNNHTNALFNGKIVDFEIIIDEIDDSLAISNNSIKIYMNREEVEIFKYRLNEVAKGNEFYPSELCERTMKNRSVTICCVVE